MERLERLERRFEEERLKTQKDAWDKARVVGTVVGAVGVPVVVLVLGGLINATLKSREVDAQYVALAVQVLRDRDTTPGSAEMRQWAVSILERLGPVGIPEESRAALVRGETSLPAPPWGVWYARGQPVDTGSRDLEIARRSELWGRAVEFLRNDLPADEKATIRRLINKDPATWWAPYYHGWGTAVRNRLREAGFGEREFRITSLESVFMELIKEAVREQP